MLDEILQMVKDHLGNNPAVAGNIPADILQKFAWGNYERQITQLTVKLAFIFPNRSVAIIFSLREIMFLNALACEIP